MHLVACPICAATLWPWQVCGGFALLRCPACGFVRIDPLPGAAALQGLYKGAHRDYFAKAESKVRRATRRLKGLRRLLGHSQFSPRLLDVGCHGGFVAAAALAQGFQVTALDPDAAALAEAAKRAAGAEFRQGRVEETSLPADTFDLVYCSEVIEHSPDPQAFMSALARALKPGGLLYLTTPDIGHWRRPRDLARWDGFDPPRHCCYFTRTSLERVLAQHGLVVVRRWFAWKPGLKLLARRQQVQAAVVQSA